MSVSDKFTAVLCQAVLDDRDEFVPEFREPGFFITKRLLESDCRKWILKEHVSQVFYKVHN